MQNVLVYAPTSATRKLYHQTLAKREIQTYLAKDMVEALLLLASFDIDTVILVEEGSIHEMDVMLEVMNKKFNHKRLILISPSRQPPRGMECYGSTRDFIELLE